MLDFANPYNLLLLLTIPAIWFLYLMSRKTLRSKLKQFGRLDVIQHLMPDVSKYKPALKLTLRLIALGALVFVLARPRFGEKEETSQREGAEIVIAFDVSRSMLAPSTDDPGSMSRLQRASMLLEKLVRDLKNDKIGLVIFANDGILRLPLTSDHRIIQLALQNELTPEMLKNQGTQLSRAIYRSIEAFPEMREGESSKSNDAHRAIIIITDAEDHEGDAVATAKSANSMGIQIDVIGVGSENGGKIPIGTQGQFLRDNEGNEVISKLNSEAAEQIAQAGKGVYVNAADPMSLQILQDSLNKLKSQEFEQITYKMSAEQFPLFAWIAIIFLIIDFIIMERKTAMLKEVNFFTRNISSIKGFQKKDNKDPKK